MNVWTGARDVKMELVSDGWVSPDTYDKFFKPVISGPAVYLFLLTEMDTFDRALIAYVGMSKRLNQRLLGHEVLAQIERPGYWPMRWFKPVPAAELRDIERNYIKKFDPPWNIIGRPRGVVLQ